ncbi:MAG: hypothetical protein IPL35_10025 [Sphingobacteriales bacterium]|nr:hypothetical protein [Sphingobacteriales bacterium]
MIYHRISIVNNKYFLWLLCCVWCAMGTISAQDNNSTATAQFYENRRAAAHFPRTFVPNFNSNAADRSSTHNIEQLRQMLLHQYLPASPHSTRSTELQCSRITESPAGIHVVFQQMVGSYEVYQGTIKVNMDKNGKIYSIFDNTFHIADNIPASVNMLPPTLVFQQYIGSRQRTYNNLTAALLEGCKPKKVLFFTNNQQAVWEIQGIIVQNGGAQYRECWIDEQGQLLYERDNSSYYGSHRRRSTNDSIAQAMVFMPDPLTQQNVFYGTPYKDDNDADKAELNNVRIQVDMPCSYKNGFFVLENDYAIASDHSAPTGAPAKSPIPEFMFTRAEQGFEDVNAYYHVVSFQQYVRSLGFENLYSKIKIDAHGSNGEDNSFFNPGAAPNDERLTFGEGGVDDAEDADVVIHEYTHALSHYASPYTNDGTERRSIDEAFGDYIACSFSRSLSEFSWMRTFTWDGHNEFWSGRFSNSTKHYPEDNKEDIYYRSEILSSVLMELWEELGREVSDKLLLQTLYSSASNITMKNVARAYADADIMLYNGAHLKTIIPYFYKRGLWDYVADAGADRDVCLGDTVILGNELILPLNATVKWSPAIGLENTNSAVVVAAPSRTTTYWVTVTDSDNLVFVDSVRITTAVCVDSIARSGKIELLNSGQFAISGNILWLRFPENTTSAEAALWDMKGALLGQWQQNSGDLMLIEAAHLPKGVYLLSVKSNLHEQSFQLMRLE